MIEKNAAPPRFAYVGCFTTEKRRARGKGVAVFRIEASGAWTYVDACATRRAAISSSPTVPGLAIMAATLSANLLSNWLRLITDPVQRSRLEAPKMAPKTDA